MNWHTIPLTGCWMIQNLVRRDSRGLFVKVYQKEPFEERGLNFPLVEEYYSLSRQNVLRGMHFQTPPFAYQKLVYCSLGAIVDVMLDLRQGSSTYGRVFSVELSAENARAIYLPEGIAHGFLVASKEAIVNYQVSSPYSAHHDHGVRWDSIGFDWNCENPILSERDLEFPSFQDFKSPFRLS